jgi:hypothetical protein
LDYLEVVIPLRDDEIKARELLAKHDLQVRKIRNQHIKFNDVLKDVQRMFKLALRTSQASTIPMFLMSWPDQSHRPQSPSENISTEATESAHEEPVHISIETKIDLTSSGMDNTREMIESADIHQALALTQSLLLLVDDVLDIWQGFQNQILSASACGSITGVAYHLMRRNLETLEITDYLACVDLPNCPDYGLLGLLLHIDEEFRAQSTFEDQNLIRKAALCDVARTLCMPTIGAYLTMWVDKSKEMREFLLVRENMPELPSALDILEILGSAGQSTGEPGLASKSAAHSILFYNWQSTAPLHFLRIAKRIGTIENLCKKLCYAVADILTKLLPQQDKPIAWQAFALHVLVQILAQLASGDDQVRQGGALMAGGRHAQTEVLGDQMLGLFCQITFPQRWKWSVI